MVRLAIFLILVPFFLSAAEWTTFRMGPFEVYTDKNQNQARSTLNHLEQLRWAFSYFTGKQEPSTLWPIRVVVSRQPTSKSLTALNDGWRGFLNEKEDMPVEWNRQIVQLLINHNLGRMPKEIEEGLVQVLSTTEVSGTHIIIGQPPKDPDLNWARMHFLMTSEDYRSRVRVVIANLNKGVDADVAYRNSLSKTASEMDQAAKKHLDASAVTTFDLAGKPLNAARDFTTRYPEKQAILRTTSDKNEPGTAMFLLENGQLEEASQTAPQWSLPFYELSKKETEPGKKAGLLKKAAELSPRDPRLWTEFALLMMEYNRWEEADQAWAQALRASPDTETRNSIQSRRSAMVELRTEAEANARKEEKLAQERELQRLKNEAVERIRNAENEANSGSTPPPAKVEAWWDGPKGDSKLTGSLTRVDCLSAGKLRLTIQAQGKNTVLSVNQPEQFTIEGEQSALSCGVQRPARTVTVDYVRGKSEAISIRFP